MHLGTARWYAVVLFTAIQFRCSKCADDNGLLDEEGTLTGHSILDTLPRLVGLKYHRNL